jgi:hypothetical protein
MTALERRRRCESVVVVTVAVVTLFCGWRHFWPDLGRDFNHLHGWGICQEAHLGRTMNEQGFATTGLVPVVLPFFDAGDNHWYYLHYPPFTHVAIALLYRAMPAGDDHRTLRLAGMALTLMFLSAVYLLAEELKGGRFAAWTMFFAAINAESLYFGVFPSITVFTILFASLAYGSYVGWKKTRSRRMAAAVLVSLCLGFLTNYFFYPAVIPLAIDLLFDQGRRSRPLALAVLFSPLLFFVFIHAYYHYGLPLWTGKEILGTTSIQNLAVRSHHELLLSFDFYSDVLHECLWYLSPTALVAAIAYWTATASRLAAHPSAETFRRRWREVFLIGTLSLGSCLFLFPQSTLDHEFTYAYLILPVSLAAAAAVYRLESRLVKLVIGATTILAAFAATDSLARTNNSPQWEYNSGVAVSLFTPPGSFVRVDLDLKYHFMFLFYAHRNLLFHVPERLEPAGVEARFELTAREPTTENGCYLAVPRTDFRLFDYKPVLRPALARLDPPPAMGTLAILGAQITGRFQTSHVVEIEWRDLGTTGEDAEIEFGQLIEADFVAFGRLRLTPDCPVSADGDAGTVYRGAYFLNVLAHDSPVRLRFIDPRTGAPLAGEVPSGHVVPAIDGRQT